MGLSFEEYGRKIGNSKDIASLAMWQHIRPMLPPAIQALRPPPDDHENGEEPARRLKITAAAEIVPRPVLWIWDQRIAQGTLSLLAGREGIGKSCLAYDLAASATRGALPGRLEGQQRGTVVAATEDSWEHTIVPRLMAARADLELIWRVDVITEIGVTCPLSLPVDLPELEALVFAKEPALILLDPLISRLDAKLDTHRDAEVRQALEPLVSIADRTNTSVLGLIHVNKSGGTDPLNMVMASKAFTAVARSVLFAMKDPQDETEARKLLGTPKNNLGRSDLPALAYTIEGRKVADHIDGDIWAGKVCWLGEAGTTINQALEDATEGAEVRTEIYAAMEWLVDYLTHTGGVSASSKVKDEAKRAGFTAATIDRARKRVSSYGDQKIVVESAGGFPRTTLWRLQEQANGSSRVTLPLSPQTEVSETSEITEGSICPVTSHTSVFDSPPELTRLESNDCKQLEEDEDSLF